MKFFILRIYPMLCKEENKKINVKINKSLNLRVIRCFLEMYYAYYYDLERNY